jgi:hypothetical protein
MMQRQIPENPPREFRRARAVAAEPPGDNPDRKRIDVAGVGFKRRDGEPGSIPYMNRVLGFSPRLYRSEEDYLRDLF